MNDYRIINKETWPRKEMFDSYIKFDDPCFNVSVALEGENIYRRSRERNESFFLLVLYAILRASNSVSQVRQRLVGEQIIEFEKIAAMTPVMTEQEMFTQIWCEYVPSFAEFAESSALKIEYARKNIPVPLAEHGDDFICASCVPWLHFTSITQAEYKFGQSVPILAWGKMKNGLIPISCKFNHAFMDGLHASRFFNLIEEMFASPEAL